MAMVSVNLDVCVWPWASVHARSTGRPDRPATEPALRGGEGRAFTRAGPWAWPLPACRGFAEAPGSSPHQVINLSVLAGRRPDAGLRPEGRTRTLRAPAHLGPQRFRSAERHVAATHAGARGVPARAAVVGAARAGAARETRAARLFARAV